MSASAAQFAFYAGALLILFLTPGPVWVALVARALSGGFHAAWPLALGVVVGDVLWPLAAIFGVSYLVSIYADFMIILKYLGALMFLIMGALLIRYPDKTLSENSKLTRPGIWAGFLAGLLVILGNPKAILFYMGVLPGFFDFTSLTTPDIVLICTLSFLVPLAGNLILATFVDRARRLIKSADSIRKLNIGSGNALICVGLIIAFF